MTLPDAAPRQELHNRRIDLTGFAREDGLWDIEGRLRDSKTYDFDSDWRGTIEPGTPFHEMWVRLTLNDDYVIEDVAVSMDAAPFTICSDIEPDFAALVGEQIGQGWRRTLARLVGGTRGCTHVVELLGTMATAAFHTIATEKARRAKAAGDQEARRKAISIKGDNKPLFIDGCHAWDASGPLVKEKFPEFYREPESDSESGD